MKRKSKFNPFLRTFIALSVLLLMVTVIAIGSFYYIFAISEPEGFSLASWPKTFTNDFSYWIKHEDETITVTDSGISRLNKNGLWIQVVDESGKEVYSYDKPKNYPIDYTLSELILLDESKYEDGHTVFISSFEDSGETWNYIIGFPYAIGKYVLYYNGEHIGRLSPVANVVIFLSLGTLVLSILGYVFWLSRQLGKMTDSIKNVSCRTYQPLKESGIFSEIYTSLNQMDIEIRSSDKLKEDTDHTRREWIANITHDLKTPLSPVKGYAELLADGQTFEIQNVQEYGGIILKNVNHIEKLINDLKLTYQLDSGTIPYKPQQVLITRYLKELMIEIVNNPAFSSRDMVFDSSVPELSVSIDPYLLRRAIQNIVINALTHNPPNTKVKITVFKAIDNKVCISICDNGIGMSEVELGELFNRYFRAESTKEHSEGSGLGLAIAKQIVTLHNGEITVKSKQNEGTEFVVWLPINSE